VSAPIARECIESHIDRPNVPHLSAVNTVWARHPAVRHHAVEQRRAIAVVQQKTGTALSVPIHPELDAAMKAGPSNGLNLIGASNGRPLKGPALSHLIRQAARAAPFRHGRACSGPAMTDCANPARHHPCGAPGGGRAPEAAAGLIASTVLYGLPKTNTFEVRQMMRSNSTKVRILSRYLHNSMCWM
jgi:hypothetical protein